MRANDPNRIIRERVGGERVSCFGGVSVALMIGHNTVRNLDYAVVCRRPFETGCANDSASGKMNQPEAMRPRISNRRGLQLLEPRR
jgi:hypothetical protein